MDHIFFQSRMSRVEDYQVVDIYINNLNLIEQIKRVEFPFAFERNELGLTGQYEGLPPLMVLAPNKHFFGKAHKAYTHGKRVSIYEYGHSGVPGEWTIAVEIKVKKKTVVWKNFKHIQRPKWDYSALGKFVFDKTQYLEALKMVDQDRVNN